MKKFLTIVLLSIAFIFNLKLQAFSESEVEYIEELNNIVNQELVTTASEAEAIRAKLDKDLYNGADKDITQLIDKLYVIKSRNINLCLGDKTHQANEKEMINSMKYNMDGEISKLLGLIILTRGRYYILQDNINKALYDFDECFKLHNGLTNQSTIILDSLFKQKKYDYADKITTILINSRYTNDNIKNKALTTKNLIEKDISSFYIDKINIPTKITAQSSVISIYDNFSMQKEYDLIKQLPYTEYQSFYNKIKTLDPDKQYKAKKQWWKDIKSAQLLRVTEANWNNYYKNYEKNKKNGIENWQKYYSNHSFDLNNPQQLKTAEAITIVLFNKEKYYHNDFYEWAEKVVDDITTCYDNKEIKKRQKWLYTILSKPIDISQLSTEEFTNYVKLIDVSSKTIDDKYIDSLTKITSNKNFNMKEFLRIYQLYGYYNLPLINKYFDSIKELYLVMCTNDEFEINSDKNYKFTVYTENRLELYSYIRKTFNFSINDSREIVEYPNVNIANKTQIVKEFEKNNDLDYLQKYKEIIKKLETKANKAEKKAKKSNPITLFGIITFPIKMIFNLLGKIFLTILGLLLVI